MYNIEVSSRAHKWGVVRQVEIKAKNGRVVATCTTQSMADKIVRGLALLKHEEQRMKEFRL